MSVSIVRKRGFRKLPAKTHAIMFPLILSLLMSGVVSTIATLKAVGLEAGIVPRILQAWGLSYAIAFPTALLVMPVVRRIVGALVETPGR
ncbi:hypothetical protein GGR34_001305 [Microvirga flocculans]|uniref:DUF2798 domain-containing protein n=1 Tax=Microvirga flocculans TaxID=217168 RepID=A0A7W6N7S3_9HYPH|nr:DUF2798 domain-containing protein [Microvirga flocculans]MBB4039663.1 hypothetical protein [Microvirga flocculans]